MPTTTKMADISAASMNTRTSLVKTAKARSLFFNLYICVRSIGRLFTPKPRILHLIVLPIQKVSQTVVKANLRPN